MFCFSSDLPNEHRLEALQCAVLMLPDENREVLMALLTFLADVAANAPLNQVRERENQNMKWYGSTDVKCNTLNF